MRQPTAWFGWTLVLALASGCSSGTLADTETDAAPDSAPPAMDAGKKCLDEVPTTCPTPAPSYTGDVLPIIEQRCYSCHADAGILSSGSGLDLGSYSALYKLRGDIASQVDQCRMPPPQAPQPTDGERATILTWLKCNPPPPPPSDAGPANDGAPNEGGPNDGGLPD